MIRKIKMREYTLCFALRFEFFTSRKLENRIINKISSVTFLNIFKKDADSDT